MPDEPRLLVALDYDEEKDGAPRVVAKGMGARAEQLIALCKEYGVPLMRDVSLSNALYRVEVGEEIPEELYDAVAVILNFVFALEAEQKK